MKEDIELALREVLFDEFSPPPIKKANLVISLCGYYSPEGLPGNVQAEIGKLNSQIATMRILDVFLGAIENRRSNEFSWNSHAHAYKAPDQVSFNPTIYQQREDDSNLYKEIERLRAELKTEPVDIGLLVSYISKKARQAGDLRPDVGFQPGAPAGISLSTELGLSC